MTTWETAREECHQAYIEPTMTRMGIQGYELKACFRHHPESDYYTLLFQRPFQWREEAPEIDYDEIARRMARVFADTPICDAYDVRAPLRTTIGDPPAEFRTTIGDPPAEFRTTIGDPPAEQGSTA